MRDALPEHRRRYPVLRGRSGSGYAPSDERKGIDRESRVLPYEPVHGCLGWPARAARRCRGQVPGDRVRQRAPESWTGSAWLRPLERLYDKVVCFTVLNQFRGVHHRWHTITPCPKMPPLGYGGGLLHSTRCVGTACGVEGGTVLTSALSQGSAHRVPREGDARAPCLPRLC
jgi:hypothetical protein